MIISNIIITPKEILQMGSFGGTYLEGIYRCLEGIAPDWLEGVDIKTILIIIIISITIIIIIIITIIIIIIKWGFLGGLIIDLHIAK
jgi:hypothetical protein